MIPSDPCRGPLTHPYHIPREDITTAYSLFSNIYKTIELLDYKNTHYWYSESMTMGIYKTFGRFNVFHFKSSLMCVFYSIRTFLFYIE